MVLEAGLTCTHNLCFEQKYENCQKNQLKIVIFTAVKNRCRLHGHVFFMLVNDQVSNHRVQRKMISVVNFFVFLISFFCFVVAICDLVHAVEVMYGLPSMLTASGKLF